MMPSHLMSLLATLSEIIMPSTKSKTYLDQKCLIVYSPNNNSLDILFDSNYQVLLINNLDLSMTYSHFLLKQSWCAFGIAHDEESMLIVTKALHQVDRHTIISISDTNPLYSVKKLNRPLIWAQQFDNRKEQSLKVVRWCPTVGKVTNPGFRTYMTCLQNDEQCRLNRQVSPECPSPLHRQKLSLSIIYAPTSALPTELTGQPIAGLHVRAFQILAKINEAETDIILNLNGYGKFDPSNMTFSPGLFGDVQFGITEFGLGGGYNSLFNAIFDLPFLLSHNEARFAARAPRPITSLSNIFKPFSSTVWVLFGVSLIFLSVCMHISYSLYMVSPVTPGLIVKEEKHKINFYIFTICKVTEPGETFSIKFTFSIKTVYSKDDLSTIFEESLPWFKGASGGGLAVVTWIFLSFYFITLYSSNLRANLILPDYEKPIETLQDILDSNVKVWIYRSHMTLSKPFLMSIGMENSIVYKIADQAEKTNGLWTVQPSNTGIGIDPRIGKDVGEHRSVFLTNPGDISYLYKTGDPYLQRHRLYLGKESADSWYSCIVVPKHSPATKHVSHVSSVIFESGLSRKFSTDYLSGTSMNNPKPEKKGLVALVLENFYAAFLLYACGMAISLLTFTFISIKNYPEHLTRTLI